MVETFCLRFQSLQKYEVKEARRERNKNFIERLYYLKTGFVTW